MLAFRRVIVAGTAYAIIFIRRDSLPFWWTRDKCSSWWREAPGAGSLCRRWSGEPMASAWFAAETHSNAERVAALNFHRQGFETFLPTQSHHRIVRRRVVEVLRPLFPRYLLVSLDLDADRGPRWRSCYSTKGVKRLLGGQLRPTPIPDRIMTEMFERWGHGPVENPAYEIGEMVRIIYGSFQDIAGEVVGSRPGYVYVLLTMMGRHVTVPVREDHIATA